MIEETINFKSLRYFVATAESLSFTKAAEGLGVPKSVISKAVARLETDLGLKLFERSSRVVRLTEAGEILYLRATSLLEEAKHIVSDVQSLQQSVNGRLRLAAPPALGRLISEKVIPDFLALWPDLSISLKLSYDYEDLFKEGLDLAFRMGKNQDDALIERKIGFANRVVVAAPAYLNGHEAIEQPEDLAGHQCLQVFERELADWTLCRGGEVRSVSLAARFQCGDMDALKKVLISGIGVAQLPWLVVRDEIASGALLHVLEGWSSTGMPISIVYREGTNKPPKLAAFLDFLSLSTGLFQLSFPDENTN